MNNLNDVVEAIFVVPDVSIVQPGSTEIFFSTSSVSYTGFWWSEGTNKYVLENSNAKFVIMYCMYIIKSGVHNGRMDKCHCCW